MKYSLYEALRELNTSSKKLTEGIKKDSKEVGALWNAIQDELDKRNIVYDVNEEPDQVYEDDCLQTIDIDGEVRLGLFKAYIQGETVYEIYVGEELLPYDGNSASEAVDQALGTAPLDEAVNEEAYSDDNYAIANLRDNIENLKEEELEQVLKFFDEIEFAENWNIFDIIDGEDGHILFKHSDVNEDDFYPNLVDMIAEDGILAEYGSYAVKDIIIEDEPVDNMGGRKVTIVI